MTQGVMGICRWFLHLLALGGTEMTKAFSVAAAFFLLLSAAELSFAKKACFQDNFTGYWEVTGGRPGKRIYTAKLTVPGFCVIGGYADTAKINSNTLLVTLFNSHDLDGHCSPVLWSATTNLNFEGTGQYDTLADGSTEGTFTLTKINCSSIPDPAQLKTNFNQTSNHPVLRKE
jgi:hypothetical protein